MYAIQQNHESQVFINLMEMEMMEMTVHDEQLKYSSVMFYLVVLLLHKLTFNVCVFYHYLLSYLCYADLHFATRQKEQC